MKGDAQPLIKFFDGADKRFIIPLYQRNYDWKIENCEQLFNDLYKLHGSERRSHFFGSIVSIIKSGSEDRLIIDGQQRITTVSLLLISMVNAYKDGEIQATDQRLVNKIFRCYLVDEYQEDERKVKLKPIKKDMDAFDALLYLPKDKYIEESNVTRNYNYFREAIVRSGLTVDEIFDCIKKLEVINIKLDEDDDPQLIFESLNSTGLDLSEADKIRNYLLMSLSPSQQDDLYTRFWNPIEVATKYDPTPFVRDYLTLKQSKITRTDKIYFVFKEYAEASGSDRAKLLEDMHHYALLYNRIDNCNMGSAKVNTILSQMRTLDSTVAYPYLLAYFDYATKNTISETEICRVLNLVESYWARRIICNIQSNGLNKVFCTLHREIENILANEKEEDNISYVDVMIYVLIKKTRSFVFPDDAAVRQNFPTRQVYRMQYPARMFLLERLENRDSNERHDVIKELSDKNITIEHIMPQTLSEKWKAALGEDYERIHSTYLHTMANITLTGYNSQYSNLTFQEKRDMEKGFKDSAFRLNNYVKACDAWTETELKKRLEELLDVVFKLWPMPQTSFVPRQKAMDELTLEDDEASFTGSKIIAFRYRGARYSVSNWKEMYLKMINLILIDERPTIQWLCANEKFGFFNTPNPYTKEIGQNMYVQADCDTRTKTNSLTNLLNECNIPLSDLVFEIRTDEDSNI